MTPYYERSGIRVYHGDAADVLPTLEAESISAVVSDPPAGIAFMSKAWDRDKGGRDQWVSWLASILSECNRSMKPGAHAVIWALPRTSGWTHRAIEDAGLDVRDCVTHLFGSGFPKSHNLPGGLGTALKPGAEFWYLARKPLSGTVAANVLAHGTGALNIDACRIAHRSDADRAESVSKNQHTRYANPGSNRDSYSGSMPPRTDYDGSAGRWPANVILDEDAAAQLDQMSGISGEKPRVLNRNGKRQMNGWGMAAESKGVVHGDTGGASRFFYVAKASRAERNAGLAGMPKNPADPYAGHRGRRMAEPSRFDGAPVTSAQNHHPTVKPLALMRWLLTLVTPPGGVVLDPFAGSGSTGVAAAALGIPCVLIEQEAEYLPIIAGRIDHALDERQEREALPRQLSIAD